MEVRILGKMLVEGVREENEISSNKRSDYDGNKTPGRSSEATLGFA
jgi:hypothetical protein